MILEMFGFSNIHYESLKERGMSIHLDPKPIVIGPDDNWQVSAL